MKHYFITVAIKSISLLMKKTSFTLNPYQLETLQYVQKDEILHFIHRRKCLLDINSVSKHYRYYNLIRKNSITTSSLYLLYNNTSNCNCLWYCQIILVLAIWIFIKCSISTPRIVLLTVKIQNYRNNITIHLYQFLKHRYHVWFIMQPICIFIVTPTNLLQHFQNSVIWVLPYLQAALFILAHL